MVTRFWAFECMFAVNNNLLMAEVYVGETRQELVKAMAAFFASMVQLSALVGGVLIDAALR